MEKFYRKFYSDRLPRLFVIGINPGRLGGGATGIPFTDTNSLVTSCQIQTSLPLKRELSATFIHRVIAAWGGPQSFFGNVYITGVCPLGLVKGGSNFNYYDSNQVLAELEPYIVDSLRWQLEAIDHPTTAVVIGTGKNLKVFHRLNQKYEFFTRLQPLEHPRFIMQYRQSQLEDYVQKYVQTLRELLTTEGDAHQ